MNHQAPDKTYPLFSEAGSEQAVIDRMGDAPNERLKEVMTSVIKHMHAVVKETEPTMEEWMAAIQFLTKTGHMCDDWRQEFILLSDTLGVSMLVDAINHRKHGGATENTVLGPFHVADAPQYEMGANICLDGKGDPLFVHGRVLDADGEPIAGAQLDTWAANPEGFYDVQQRGIQPDMNLRGVFVTGEDGSFHFRTVKALHYPIPDDGSVGDLLKQTGRHPMRPAHIHFIVSADGFIPVTTHLFDSTCPWLYSDAVFGVKESLVAEVKEIDDEALGKARDLPAKHAEIHWDFILQR
ncbi:MAG: intradiol ring-cleavage dioxygenase [Burkholderiaceae bacterium]